MKRLLIFWALVTTMCAHAEFTNLIYTHALDGFVLNQTNIPAVRSIQGGTVIKVSYTGDWSNEMKGAFEYACKIWEENLPSIPPIIIRASISQFTGSNASALSTVRTQGLVVNDEWNWNRFSLNPRMKAVIFKEYVIGACHQFVDSLPSDAFNTPDILITYNSSRLDEMSFSLNQVQEEKFDFVTLVLRDIARGLGFMSSFTAESEIEELYAPNRKLHAFEELLSEQLFAADVSQTPYIAATNDSLILHVGTGDKYNTINLYAPATWQNGISLNYTLPEADKPITQLLTPYFYKGCSFRDIADDYSSLFFYGLLWQPNFTTGDNNSSSESGSTEEIVPYKGLISPPGASSLTTSTFGSIINRPTPVDTLLQSYDFSVETLCKPYTFFILPDSISSTNHTGWAAALLKKDGKWDPVFYAYHLYPSLTIDVNDFQMGDLDDYARTCDGYLRCRVTHATPRRNAPSGYYDYAVSYFAIDEIPQIIKPQLTSEVTYSSTNPYAKTITISMKNLEGATAVIAEILDEGETNPRRIDLLDFRKGHFQVTVDREYYSDITVVAYNDNGSTRSATIHVPAESAANSPISPFKASLTGHEITIVPEAIEILDRQSSIEYQILPIMETGPTALVGRLTSTKESINIEDLTPGLYVLLYSDSRGRQGTLKFRR